VQGSTVGILLNPPEADAKNPPHRQAENRKR